MSDEKLKPREIILITRSESHSSGLGDKIEQIAKVASLIAVPVVLGIVGWFIQERLASRNVSQEYVKTALSLLTASDQSKVEGPLREWAVDLLNENSPTKFSPQVRDQLKSGELRFSMTDVRAILGSGEGALAISPDGKRFATGDTDGMIKMWDIATGKPVSGPLRGHLDAVTSIAFSPDARRLISGSWDRTARIWDIQAMRELWVLPVEDGIIGVGFLPDATRVIVRTRDGTVSILESSTGVLIQRIQLR